ncbi:type II toxin-antitoxin system RelE/ParE family toxin [Leptospira levettii]|uniref:type II toxin-antitoxin system RelE/ParE family toxin n=1 Tax=Leptospira levettii TaxID=2023178 RepID=UPI0010921640|nr:type II toxin-antitoxin system RelE/ParE family toxin [Leptospira levettii]TGM78614.1 type II toxin-antitoxin system RelE/ParE family toxin [Leptospira levettii]
MTEKPLVWLKSEIKTPPFSEDARLEAGFNLRKLQDGEILSMPISRPMPSIGSSCHELRIKDGNKEWRVMYSIQSDAIIILDVFPKKTKKTPKLKIDICKTRLKEYQTAIKD